MNQVFIKTRRVCGRLVSDASKISSCLHFDNEDVRSTIHPNGGKIPDSTASYLRKDLNLLYYSILTSASNVMAGRLATASRTLGHHRAISCYMLLRIDVIRLDGRLGSRLQGYHPVALRPLRYGPYMHRL
jgi:hypothetical protein